MLVEALKSRKAQYAAKLGELSYEKIRLLDRIKDLDTSIKQIEAAQIENNQALKDVSTQEAIDKAKEKSETGG